MADCYRAVESRPNQVHKSAGFKLFGTGNSRMVHYPMPLCSLRKNRHSHKTKEETKTIKS